MIDFLNFGENIVCGRFNYAPSAGNKALIYVYCNLCNICGCSIDKNNDTREHLIPQSIGGRLKVKGFICRKCNSESGDKWDFDLADSLNPLNLLCRVRRERKPPPSQVFQTVGGASLEWNANGSYKPSKPTFSKIETNEGFNINIVARDIKEARSILKGQLKKHPNIDVEKILTQAKVESVYSSDPLEINLNFGGHLTGRSLIKSALCLVYCSGIDTRFCNLAFSYLNGTDDQCCWGYYNVTDLVLNREKGLSYHCVYVKGDSVSGLITAYIEYFGCYRMVACLSDCYTGEAFSNLYAIDPVTGDLVDLSIDLSFTYSEILDIYDYKKVDFSLQKEIFENIVERAMANSFEAEKNRVINEALEYAFENCSIQEGYITEPSQMQEIIDLTMEKMKPFLLHHNRSN
ncbi:HNH endonuclease [Vreelandella sp. H-I2]